MNSLVVLISVMTPIYGLLGMVASWHTFRKNARLNWLQNIYIGLLVLISFFGSLFVLYIFKAEIESTVSLKYYYPVSGVFWLLSIGLGVLSLRTFGSRFLKVDRINVFWLRTYFVILIKLWVLSLPFMFLRSSAVDYLATVKMEKLAQQVVNEKALKLPVKRVDGSIWQEIKLDGKIFRFIFNTATPSSTDASVTLMQKALQKNTVLVGACESSMSEFLEKNYSLQYEYFINENTKLFDFKIVHSDCSMINGSGVKAANFFAENYKDALPARVDEDSVLLQISSNSTAYIRKYILPAYSMDEIDKAALSELLTPSVRAVTCASPDTFLLIRKGLVVEDIYYGNDKKEILKIKTGLNHCSRQSN